MLRSKADPALFIRSPVRVRHHGLLDQCNVFRTVDGHIRSERYRCNTLKHTVIAQAVAVAGFRTLERRFGSSGEPLQQLPTKAEDPADPHRTQFARELLAIGDRAP